jgi:hypothetical protein
MVDAQLAAEDSRYRSTQGRMVPNDRKIINPFSRRNAMKLASKVLLCALAIFVLSAVAFAQTPRGENDPRNQSPSVGTGGTEGGPTGLFTVYDGSTLRKGEFSFSIAYSRFDRDPGDLKISEIPISFNIGLNDYVEVFFKTNAHRTVHVNSPGNLSSFYLPDAASPFGAALPAIVLAPTGPNVGTILGRTLFRPAGNQPVVAFPYVGGSAGTFGLTSGVIGAQFGFPGFSAALGPPSGSTFPGVGSPAGSILPGVVLATSVLPGTVLTGPTTVPTSFTTNPSYNPEAPFIGTTDGSSSFTNIVFGGKFRFTNPNNRIGAGVVAFYRWWLKKATSNFTDLQQGAGPGGNKGDFGFVGFVDGRLSRSVNVSANVGYIVNSNPRATIGGTQFTLLDRPNEVVAGLGFDFPINEHFQPIFELHSVQYVGTQTPNAFPNDPLDALFGVKVYARRNLGFGVWYRMQLNQQSAGHYNSTANASITVNQLTGVNVIGRGVVTLPALTLANGLPAGFRFSDNPNGFGFQFFAGLRNKREPAILPNQPPVASLAASTATIMMPCAPGSHSRAGSCPATANTTVGLATTASDPDGDTLLYSYTVTGGRITGEGANVSWDLGGVGPGTYTASVEVDDGCGCITQSSTTVTVANCGDCVPDVVCPTINLSCPDAVDEGTPVTIKANIGPATPAVSSYNWTVSAGTITSGQGTDTITVDTAGKGGQSITATVELVGVDPSCGKTGSCTTPIRPKVLPRKFDEYGNIRFNDEKARLDNFAIQLQNEPTAQGYIIGYGSCGAEGQTRANRAKDYLVNTRGIDAGRIVVVDGGCLPDLLVQLWVVPQGATAPAGDATGVVSPCPDCKKKPAKRRGGRRGEE